MLIRAPAGVKATSWQPDTYEQLDGWLSKASAAPAAAEAADESTRIAHRLLDRTLPLVVHGAYPQGEIEPVLAIVDKYHLRLIIYHCESCDENIEELVARRVPVVVGPRVIYWNRGRVTNIASMLRSHGLTVALGTDASDGEGKYLLDEAGLAMHYGLSLEDALAAVTISPAKMMGIDDRVGSLAPGRDADLVVLSGPVFASTTHVERVLIEGHTWYRR